MVFRGTDWRDWTGKSKNSIREKQVVAKIFGLKTQVFSKLALLNIEKGGLR